MNEGPGLVAPGCNNHPMAVTVRNSARNKNKRKAMAESRSKLKTQIAGRTEKNGHDKVKPGTVLKGEVLVSAENPD